MQNFKRSITMLNTTVEFITDRLETILSEHAFRVLYIHNVQATLQEKGFDMAPYRIIEFCRAPAALRVLSEDPDIGLFLPCKFLVYQKENDVRVTTFLPTAMSEFYPDANLGDLPDEIEKDILEIMHSLE